MLLSFIEGLVNTFKGLKHFIHFLKSLWFMAVTLHKQTAMFPFWLVSFSQFGAENK
jgi:hypothetical protein